MFYYHVLVREKGQIYWTDVYQTFIYPLALIVTFYQRANHYKVEIRKGEPIVGMNR